MDQPGPVSSYINVAGRRTLDQAARQRFERRVRELEAFGHRGSATANEARAGDYLQRELEAIGLPSEREPFRGCRSVGLRVFLHLVVAGVGAALLWTFPLATLLLGLIALGSFFLEEARGIPTLGRLVPGGPSSNVVARIAPRGDVQARLVLVAHYDTQRTGLMWREEIVRHVAPLLSRMPGMLKSPLFAVVFAMGAQVALGAAALVWPEAVRHAGFGVLVVYGVAGGLTLDWGLGRFVPGASDNGTGTAAAIALTEDWLGDPVGDVELTLLLTGCEEAGLQGATAWLRAHQGELNRVPTRFLNLDSLGYGRPRFLGGEHSLFGSPARYPSEVVRLCAEVASQREMTDAGPKVLPVPTDGLAFLACGVEGASVLCFDDHGHMPNYHQLTDTSDNLSFDIAWEAVSFSRDLLRRLAGLNEDGQEG